MATSKQKKYDISLSGKHKIALSFLNRFLLLVGQSGRTRVGHLWRMAKEDLDYLAFPYTNYNKLSRKKEHLQAQLQHLEAKLGSMKTRYRRMRVQKALGPKVTVVTARGIERKHRAEVRIPATVVSPLNPAARSFVPRSSPDLMDVDDGCGTSSSYSRRPSPPRSPPSKPRAAKAKAPVAPKPPTANTEPKPAPAKASVSWANIAANKPGASKPPPREQTAPKPAPQLPPRITPKPTSTIAPTPPQRPQERAAPTVLEDLCDEITGLQELIKIREKRINALTNQSYRTRKKGQSSVTIDIQKKELQLELLNLQAMLRIKTEERDILEYR